MEKVVNLKNDKVFQHIVPYNDAVDYSRNEIKQTAIPSGGIREEICDLVIQGKLDATDLKIIAARDCSPMPSVREVAGQVGIGVATVLRRTEHIKDLIVKDMGQ